ncbi:MULTISPECIES: hypothetical protein [Fusobacterium]|uniref:hypothetical protein n=1 Tax=Fusobacterium TaxID=848 RepID=UPI001476BC70|nr:MULTISPECIES: hypothetical protein [Fusobacterium]NME34996.1 hypothetical protein [Fusobacterium sp. FSA-380-WT-3A]
MSDIYIGDKVNLNIQGTSKENIISSFKDYHIDGVDKDNTITFRSFKVGDNIIDIGNNQINLKVASSITKEDKNIYMNLTDESNKIVNSGDFPFITLLGVIMFLTSISYFIINFSKKKKIEKIIPIDEKCKNILENLSDENFHFEISIALREYIDYICKSNFLAGVYKENSLITKDDIEFLKTLDYYKFSQNKIEDKNSYKIKALKIFNKLKGGENNV